MLVTSLGDPVFTTDQSFIVVRSPVRPFNPSRRRHIKWTEYTGREMYLHTIRHGVSVTFTTARITAMRTGIQAV